MQTWLKALADLDQTVFEHIFEHLHHIALDYTRWRIVGLAQGFHHGFQVGWPGQQTPYLRAGLAQSHTLA